MKKKTEKKLAITLASLLAAVVIAVNLPFTVLAEEDTLPPSSSDASVSQEEPPSESDPESIPESDPESDPESIPESTPESGSESNPESDPESTPEGMGIAAITPFDIMAGADAYASDFAELMAAAAGAPTDGTEYVIEITQDINIVWDMYGFKCDANQNIVLQSTNGSFSLKRDSSFSGRMLLVKELGELTLRDITVDGQGDLVNASEPMIWNTGTLHLQSGAVLQNAMAGFSNFTAMQYQGAAVNCSYNSSALLTMHDGAIIRNNTVRGSNYYGEGAGVFIYNATFIMYGGEITGNLSKPTSFLTGAGHGGGVCVTGSNASFTMLGGTITGNDSNYGGGVYLIGATMTMSDNATISGNTALSGGGVYADFSKVTMSGNATISGNTGNLGGGIYMRDSSATSFSSLTMNDAATIRGNEAASGGGVYTSAIAPIYSKLFVNSAAVSFADNIATDGAYYLTNPQHIATHQSNIATTQFTGGFKYGYNNNDINLTDGRLAYKIRFEAGAGGALDPSKPAIPSSGWLYVPDGALYNAATQTITGGSDVSYYDAIHLGAIPNLGNALTNWTDNNGNEVTTIEGDITLRANFGPARYTITFDSQGGTRTGGGELVQTANYGGSVTAPTLTRAGYTFSGWNRAFTNITQNLTIIAQWTKIEEGSSGTVPTNSDPTSGGSSGGGSSSSRTSSSSSSSAPVISSSSSSPSAPVNSSPNEAPSAPAASTPAVVTAAAGGTTPSIISNSPEVQAMLDAQRGQGILENLQNGNVPLGGISLQGAWGFVNLFLALISVAIMLLSALRWVLKKRTLLYDSTGEPLRSERYTRILLIARGAAIMFGIFTPIAFFILEDLNQPMAMINANTPIILFVALLQPLALVGTLLAKRVRDKSEQELQNAADIDIKRWLETEN